MTQREIHDADGTRWTLVQAFAGPGSDEATAEAAAEVLTDGDGVPVVATPSGGAQTVRLALPADWADALDDDALAAAVAEARDS